MMMVIQDGSAGKNSSSHEEPNWVKVAEGDLIESCTQQPFTNFTVAEPHLAKEMAFRYWQTQTKAAKNRDGQVDEATHTFLAESFCKFSILTLAFAVHGYSYS